MILADVYVSFMYDRGFPLHFLLNDDISTKQLIGSIKKSNQYIPFPVRHYSTLAPPTV